MNHHQIHLDRRQRVLQQLAPGDGMLIPSAAEAHRNSDVHFPYRNHSDFLYLTGLTEPSCVAWLERGMDGTDRFILFVRRRDREREIWDGRRTGVAGAVETWGADEAYPIDELPKVLPQLLEGIERLHYPFLRSHPFQGIVQEAMGALRRGGGRKRRSIGPLTIVDTYATLAPLRLRKTEDDISVLARAVEISAAGHRAAMAAAAPGMNERQLQGIVEGTFLQEGSDHWGYPSIVGAGVNACILHYHENCAEIGANDLVLIDAGAEWHGFSGDITRTFPASGRFTGPQRDLYEVVLASELAAVDDCRVGRTFDDVHQTALSTLVDGMLQLGLLTGSRDEVIESGSYRRFYMHSTSHWLGMDVHDVGTYREAGAWRNLEPGMALTVEPGIYVSPDDTEAPEHFRGIGIRIEDDVVVTAGAPRVLSEGAPKTVAEVEAACS